MPSDLSVTLHPLVLLTISDYITRHTLRNQHGPIAGALLGQQIGRTITLEHAFDILLQPSSGDGGADEQYTLDEDWFRDRLQQYKDVHQNPALDFVGWFTTAPETGPTAAHQHIHSQLAAKWNDGAVLLAFHPAKMLSSGDDAGAVGANLPLSIYEGLREAVDSKTVRARGADEMDTGGAERPEDAAGLEVKFKELPYTIETGEAEMIAVDFVAKGAGYATARGRADDANAMTQGSGGELANGSSNGKGKGKSVPSTPMKEVDDSKLLSAEDEELVASLNSRANAIRMLHTRIRLLKAYLSSLPPSYLSQTPPNAKDDSKSLLVTDMSADPKQSLDYPLLRSIQALLAALPLVLPSSDLSTYKQETMAETFDVNIVSLLGLLGRGIEEAKEMGKKFAIVDAGANSARKMDAASFKSSFDLGVDGNGPASSLISDGLYG